MQQLIVAALDVPCVPVRMVRPAQTDHWYGYPVRASIVNQSGGDLKRTSRIQRQKGKEDYMAMSVVAAIEGFLTDWNLWGPVARYTPFLSLVPDGPGAMAG